MSIVKKAFQGMQSCCLKGYMFNRYLITSIGECLNIFRKKKLADTVSLNEEQISEIQNFFIENYGKKVPTNWHRLYQSYTGRYQKDYFPEFLFSTKYEPKVNGFRPIAAQFGDKNLLHQLFGKVEGIVIPKTYYSCVNGTIRNDRNQLISHQEMCRSVDVLCAVIKKSIDSSSGRDVQIVDFVNGIDKRSGKEFSEIIADFKDNFVIQDVVQQHEVLAKINPSSLNTFRVMTYIFDNKVNVCPIALRLGRYGADRDNIHYGGIVVGVEESGKLREFAFSEYGERFSEHPDTHVVFENTHLPFVDALKEKAKLLHSELPWLKVISWDLTVNKEGSVTLIEANTIGGSAWFPQMVNGEPLFGENTAEILKFINQK